MPNKSTAFANEIANLRRNYIEQLANYITFLRKAENHLEKDLLPITDVQELYRLSHNFSGSGATFGFPDISDCARELYNSANDFLVGKENHPHPQSVILRTTRNLIAAMVAIKPAILQSPQSKLISSQISSDLEFSIIIKNSKHTVINDLAHQLQHFGYLVGISDDIPKNKPTNSVVQAVIAQVEENDENFESIELWGHFAALYEAPFLLISPHDDFSSRLAAVQAGAQGYFTTPIDVLKIIDRIEQLHPIQQAKAGWNILIIDDDVMLGEFYSKILQAEKMSVTINSDPRQVLETLSSQAFDLVLIDYLMPECGGQELAQIIRQQERYLSLPIIFMSSDQNIEARLIDQDLGIDDFLIKPFTTAQLVSVVKSRARRAAELRTLMTHDSFTGLLNHAAFNERLSLEVSIYTRTKIEATCVLIDIDYFKKVNDTYGHATGDKVIKSLARLMQQHLRRTDIIGRCGGEEFGIIMPGCPINDAKRIIEDLRIKFSAMEFVTGNGEILHVTFSGGLTPFAAGKSIDQIINSADNLLYDAKKRGRNNIASD